MRPRAKVCSHSMAGDYNALGERVSRGQAVYRRCTVMWGGCGEYIPWGPANDADDGAQIWAEQRAAELAIRLQRELFFSHVSDIKEEHRGWSLGAGHAAGDDYPPPDEPLERAGWLAFFIVHHGEIQNDLSVTFRGSGEAGSSDSPAHAHAVGGGHVRSGESPATGNVADPQVDLEQDPPRRPPAPSSLELQKGSP